jgi:hypothetical protein
MIVEGDASDRACAQLATSRRTLREADSGSVRGSSWPAVMTLL